MVACILNTKPTAAVQEITTQAQVPIYDTSSVYTQLKITGNKYVMQQ